MNAFVKEICDTADVQKSRFYHYFSSKQSLMLAVLDEHFLGFKEQILTRSFRSDDASGEYSFIIRKV